MRPIVFERIIKTLNWQGVKMIFPYTLNGYGKEAVIELKDLYKIIKWKTK